MGLAFCVEPPHVGPPALPAEPDCPIPVPADPALPPVLEPPFAAEPPPAPAAPPACPLPPAAASSPLPPLESDEEQDAETQAMVERRQKPAASWRTPDTCIAILLVVGDTARSPCLAALPAECRGNVRISGGTGRRGGDTDYVMDGALVLALST